MTSQTQPTVTITETDGKIAVSCPYDSDFVSRAKKLKGRWDSASKTWRFDARSREAVEALLTEQFGVADGVVPTVDIYIEIPEGVMRDDTVSAWGQTVFRRTGRDADVWWPDNVIVHYGDFNPSGGSKKSPVVGGHSFLRVEIRDLPAVLFPEDEGAEGWWLWTVIRRTTASSDPASVPGDQAECPTCHGYGCLPTEDADGNFTPCPDCSGSDPASVPGVFPPPVNGGTEGGADPQTAGAAWGRTVARTLRHRGKRTVAGLSNRYFTVAARNIGRGQVFYLAAGYGIIRGR